jgi:hypothetical protein
MKNKIVNLIFCLIFAFSSCNDQEEVFESRLHTPNEEIDWYYKLGKTNFDKHWTDINSINWEKEFWEEYKSGRHNYSFLEVMDISHNTHFSVSTLPLEDSYQFSLSVGSRNLKDEEGNITEKGYVRCYLLNSNDLEKVKRLMQIFFKQNYNLFFSEISKLEVIFEVEDLYQNIE